MCAQGGARDELKKTRLRAPLYHFTDFSIIKFESWIKDIMSLPELAGFEIDFEKSDWGQAIESTDPGSRAMGRSPELFMIMLKNKRRAETIKMVPEALRMRVDKLREAIRKLKSTQSMQILTLPRVQYSGFNFKSRLTPEYVALVFELFPEDQARYEKKVGASTLRETANRVVEIIAPEVFDRVKQAFKREEMNKK